LKKVASQPSCSSWKGAAIVFCGFLFKFFQAVACNFQKGSIQAIVTFLVCKAIEEADGVVKLSVRNLVVLGILDYCCFLLSGSPFA